MCDQDILNNRFMILAVYSNLMKKNFVKMTFSLRIDNGKQLEDTNRHTMGLRIMIGCDSLLISADY